MTGSALVPELLVYPNPIDYGPVPVQCSLTQTVHLENIGVTDLVVTAIAADLPTVTLSLPELPLTLAPGAEALVSATYTPVDTTGNSGGLYITSNDMVGVRGVALAGEGTMDDSLTEEFIQGDGPFALTDILLYVDGSCSMEDDQANLAGNFALFADALADVSLDWQLAVSTQDDGCHNGDYYTADNLDTDELLAAVRGPVGAYTEAGLTIADNALSHLDGCNADWLRPESKTTIVLLVCAPVAVLVDVRVLADLGGGGVHERIPVVAIAAVERVAPGLQAGHPSDASGAEPGAVPIQVPGIELSGGAILERSRSATGATTQAARSSAYTGEQYPGPATAT